MPNTGHAPDRLITSSVIVIVGGCIIASAGDLSFNLSGYTYALLSCSVQAAYLVLVELQVIFLGLF